MAHFAHMSTSEWHLKTPVVFIIFNRPDTTARVFEEIRRARPLKLLVIADGPRLDHPEDANRCAATRAIVEQVDWPCEVLKNYAETNLGCKRRVSSGLDWVFDTIEEAIILEDDCLPHPTFFRFCEELLDRYRLEPSVMTISGNYFHGRNHRPTCSYFFSHYDHCWGWASWRRAWQHYDCDMSQWPALRDTDWLLTYGDGNRDFQRYWTRVFDMTFTGKIDTWNYQWKFSCFVQDGLSILPSKNLVKNIGFGQNATHTRGDGGWIGRLPLESISFPLEHPKEIARDRVADRWTDLNVVRTSVPIAERILRRIWTLARRITPFCRPSR